MKEPVSCRPGYMDLIIMAAWAGEMDAELKVHLDDCALCRSALEVERALSGKAAEAATDIGEKAGEGLAERIFARTTRLEKRSFNWKFPTAVLAGAAAASLFFYTQKNSQIIEEDTPEDPVSFAEVDIEVLENMEVLEQMEMLEILDAFENLGDS